MIHTDEDDEFERIAHEIEMKKGQPYVYETKREWVSLTDEQIFEMYRMGWNNNMDLARAIEQALKELNT